MIGDIVATLIIIGVVWHLLMGIGMAVGAVIYTVKVDLWDMWWKNRWMNDIVPTKKKER